MDFWEVVKTRRSVRSFAKRDVPESVLERVLEAARIAPSGNNRQPWSFVVVRGAKKRGKIAEACYGQGFVAEAPVVVVCCAERYANSYEPWGDRSYLADAIIAFDHLVLAARNEGLGTCWVGAVHDGEVKKIVNAPDNVDVLMVIPVGYPAHGSAFGEGARRKPLEEIRFFEEYGATAG